MGFKEMVAVSTALYCLSISYTVFADSQKELDLVTANGVVGIIKRFNATWLSDTEFYYETYESTLRAFDAEKKSFRVAATPDILTKWEGAGYYFLPDNKKILVQYDQDVMAPAILIAKYDVYDMETKKTTTLGNGKRLRKINWSPTSDKIAFVSENNIYIWNTDGKEVQLTTTGVDGVIYNGITDWVYKEEIFFTDEAFWFSPDGEKLAFGYFDDTNVKDFPGELKTQYPTEVINHKYPFPGTPNPKVMVKVVDLKSPEKSVAEFAGPSVVTDDHILGSVTWTDKDHILVKWLNRVQDIATFQLCDLAGKCNEVMQITEPKGWVEAKVVKCLADGNNCILLNWIGNWYQIWNLDLKTGKNTWESLGDISVNEFYGYQETTKTLYFQATLAKDQGQLHVYKNKECISCSLKDADGIACKHASAKFSKDLSYYILTCGGPSIHYTKVYESKTDKSVYDWELNEEAKKELSSIVLPKFEVIQVPLSGEFKTSVKLFQSPNLDEKSTYPLIVYIQSAPVNRVDVTNEYECGWFGYISAGRNIVLAVVDVRGAGLKGKDQLYSMKGGIGPVESEDIFAVIKYLQEKYKFIDPKRIGISGVYYGAYLAAVTVSNDPEKKLKCAIAQQSISSWNYYDSFYTEKYLGIPTNKDDLKNYETADLTRNVNNIKGHELLLIHSNNDYNTHSMHTLILSEALKKNDIPFEILDNPDSSLAKENFWNKCFDLKAP